MSPPDAKSIDTESIGAESIDAEYIALTSGAGFVDCSERTQIEVTGDDRAAFLHNLSTAAIRSLQPGQGCEAFALDVRGHTLGHFLVFCTPHSLIIDSAPGQNDRLAAHFEKYHIRERVEIHDRTPQWGELLLSGAKGQVILESLATAVSGGTLPRELLSHREAHIAEQTVWLRNVEIAGKGGVLISAAQESIASIAAALVAGGAMRCGPAALETARVEAGWPIFGVDISDKNLPQEVGRSARAISFTKGCYLGQETVARIDALGHVNKTLCGVRFSGREIPPPGLELRSGDAVVGTVTSVVFSPRLSAPLALAYIRRGLNVPGTKLAVSQAEAEIIALPLN
jgi:folate-binding protein YgfZ